MSDLVMEMRNDLAQLKGKSADYITHMLKQFDGGVNGSMLGGLLKFVDTITEEYEVRLTNEKKKSGTLGFLVGTITAGVICAGIKACSSYQKKKLQHENIKRLANIVKNEIAVANDEERNGVLHEDDEGVISDNTLYSTDISVECPICGGKANGIDEIIKKFGYKKSEGGSLEREICCKECRRHDAINP